MNKWTGLYSEPWIETDHLGIRFRSRLEARWASFFYICKLHFVYESPIYYREGYWHPDFFLLFEDRPVLIEVKPTTQVHLGTVQRMCDHEMPSDHQKVLVGLKPTWYYSGDGTRYLRVGWWIDKESISEWSLTGETAKFIRENWEIGGKRLEYDLWRKDHDQLAKTRRVQRSGVCAASK